MSTIHFSAEELGNVAAWAASRSGIRGSKGELLIAPWAEMLESVSAANVSDYVASYGHANAPATCTAGEIAAAAPSAPRMSPAGAVGSVVSMLYNIDQDKAAAVLAVASLATMAARERLGDA